MARKQSKHSWLRKVEALIGSRNLQGKQALSVRTPRPGNTYV